MSLFRIRLEVIEYKQDIPCANFTDDVATTLSTEMLGIHLIIGILPRDYGSKSN